MGAVGVAGWGIAGAGLVVAAFLRARLSRQSAAVARACHELRGPLTAARLGLEHGSRIRPLPPRRLRAIELELGRATLAVEDLTAVRVRWPAARLEPVDLAELAADSVEAWRPIALTYASELRLDRPRERAWVVGERLRLAQAMGNLIANGIEHGGGEVVVRLQARRAQVRFEVVDAGPGLPTPIEELCSRRRSRRIGGSERGHGLAIVSAVAAAHGGRLTAAPTERGARLVLELPAADETRRARDLDDIVGL